MLDGLKKLLGAGASNIATHARGVVNQLNQYDGGRTYSDAWDRPVPITSRPGRWYGIPGGDQEWVPSRGSSPMQMPTLVRPTPNQLSVGQLPPQPSLSVGDSNQMQPFRTYEDGVIPRELLQNPVFNQRQMLPYARPPLIPDFNIQRQKQNNIGTII